MVCGVVCGVVQCGVHLVRGASSWPESPNKREALGSNKLFGIRICGAYGYC